MAEIIRLMPTPPSLPGEQMLDWFRAQPTAQLKRMWDDVDRFHVYCDEIHFVMNERGEGSYVAV